MIHDRCGRGRQAKWRAPGDDEKAIGTDETDMSEITARQELINADHFRPFGQEMGGLRAS